MYDNSDDRDYVQYTWSLLHGPADETDTVLVGIGWNALLTEAEAGNLRGEVGGLDVDLEQINTSDESYT